jgi:sec-independent protein translocase protein TatB
MFDIGFSEILVIFVLALVVLGPEKLPRVAAQVGRWIGRARGMARQFREQLEEEVNLEETRKASQASSRNSPAGAPTNTAPGSAAIPGDSATTPMSPAVTAPGSAVPMDSATSADSAAGEATNSATGRVQPPRVEPEQPVYPDYYSHAHPTDSLGRPIPAPTSESSDVGAGQDAGSGQQDWVGGVTGTEKPHQTTAAAAYAPSHERGT